MGFTARLNRWWYGQDSHILEIVRGASIAGVLKAFTALLLFGLSVVLGRVLGAEATGAYFLALTIVTIAATVGRVGLDSAVLRFIAAHASTDNWQDVGRTLRAATNIGLICSASVAAILYASAGVLADRVFSDATLAGPIRVMTIAVVPLSLSVLVSRALQGLSRIRDSVLVFSILPAGIALVGTWLLGREFGLDGAIVAYVVAVTVALLYSWIAWRRAMAGHTLHAQPQPVASTAGELLYSGAPLLIGALLQLVMQMSGTLMLGAWGERTDVSLFSLAWRASILLTFALIAVNTIAQPKFAELYARGEMKLLATTASKATLLMTLCAAPVLLVFLLAPELVMSAFGNEFTGGARTLQVLSVGQFVNVATGSVGILLVMSGHEREYRNVQIVAACMVVVLNVLLIPLHGALGAAIAAASGLVVQNILFGYFVWAKLGILTVVPRSCIHRPIGDA